MDSSVYHKEALVPSVCGKPAAYQFLVLPCEIRNTATNPNPDRRKLVVIPGGPQGSAIRFLSLVILVPWIQGYSEYLESVRDEGSAEAPCAMPRVGEV